MLQLVVTKIYLDKLVIMDALMATTAQRQINLQLFALQDPTKRKTEGIAMKQFLVWKLQRVVTRT